MKTMTLGRKPTLGEVTEYYTQPSFLRFMLDTLQHRRVVLVISTKQHWEPNWERDEVKAVSVDELRQFIADRIAAAFPGATPDTRPDYYPSFHQSVWKGPRDPEGAVDKNATMDCVFEADLTTWHDAFRDVAAAVALFDRYNVPYQHKFSGHRSLHIMLPGDIVPHGYRGLGTRKLAGKLLHWSSSEAHHLPKITRMPYSLNEDTGLISLPIEQGKLDRFRPWQANLHLVRVPETSWDIWGTEADEANLTALLQDLKTDESDKAQSAVPGRASLATAAPDLVLAPYRERLVHLRGNGAQARAWTYLSRDEAMPEPALLEALQAEDADARWLAAEAYLFHGTALSKAAFHALLAQEEEYVKATATDVLLRFEEAIVPSVAKALEELNAYTVSGARAAYLLTHSQSLRDAVFETLMASSEQSHDARIAVACLAGATLGNWHTAMALAAPARQDHHLPPENRARLRRKLRALEIMRTIGGWDKREEAEKARKLAALGPQITDLLLVAANSPLRRFRRGIVTALSQLGDPRSVALLIYALNDDYTKVRRKAIAGLVRIGEPAVDELIAAAASDQVRIRRNAVRCLGNIGAPRGKPVIIEALHDAEEIVRRQAVRALKELVTIEDLATLKQFLREAVPDNALEAVELLTPLGEPGVLAMETMAIEERNPAAAYFIARRDNAGGREILLSQLDDDETRAAAVEFLRELRDPVCVPYLGAQLDASTDWHGMFIAGELGEIGTQEAVEALIRNLSRDNHLIRRGAVRGLAKAKDPSAIPALIACMEDRDGKVRKLASDALTDFGEATMRAVTQMLSETDDNNVRRRNALMHMRTVLERAEKG